jgi:hypothetical protein
MPLSDGQTQWVLAPLGDGQTLVAFDKVFFCAQSFLHYSTLLYPENDSFASTAILCLD